MKRTKCFIDLEFSGLHQATTLMSLGIVTETGETFYCEATDFDRSQLTPWLIENVIAHMQYIQEQNITQLFMQEKKRGNTVVVGDKDFIKAELIKWLSNFGMVEFWGDVMAYDWVLMVDLLATYENGYPKMPENVYYINFDITSLFVAAGVDPDISRDEFTLLEIPVKLMQIANKKHHALADAIKIRACYNKLINHYLRKSEIDTKLSELEKELREPGILHSEIVSLGWEPAFGLRSKPECRYTIENPNAGLHHELTYNRETNVVRIHQVSIDGMQTNGTPLFAGVVYGKDDLLGIMIEKRIQHPNFIPKTALEKGITASTSRTEMAVVTQQNHDSVKQGYRLIEMDFKECGWVKEEEVTPFVTAYTYNNKYGAVYQEMNGELIIGLNEKTLFSGIVADIRFLEHITKTYCNDNDTH